MATKLPKSYEYLTIDFETQDQYLDLKLGSGWVYGDIWVGGCAIQYPDGTATYETDRAKYKKIINKAKKLIVFNFNYDIGILKMLNMDIEKFIIIDVMLMARLHRSNERGYSLNFLSKKYLKDQKSDAPLGELAQELGLVKNCKQNAVKVAKTNMKPLQEANYDLVAEYAIHDVVLTYKLYEYFLTKEPEEYYQFDLYSDLAKCMILNRARGVYIDLVQLMRVQAQLQIELLDAQLHLNAFNDGTPVNTSSTDDVCNLLVAYDLPLGVSKSGGRGADKYHLETLDHEVPKAMLAVRELRTLKNNFIDKILEAQKYTIKMKKPDGSLDLSAVGGKTLVGKVYPEIKIFGAKTGRCSSNGPNIQQIPSRGKLAKLVRSIFIPNPGDMGFCSVDFSAQEPRLQVHYAAMAKCTDHEGILNEFIHDPNTDFHKIASEQMNISRGQAKTIGLGLLYGMGLEKLAGALNCGTEEAKYLKHNYFESLPYIKELINKASLTLKKKGYIVTLGGRKVYMDKPTVIDGELRSFEYKAINFLIQGSAADQSIIAMVDLYRKGVPFLFPVHDDINASIQYEGHVEDIQYSMENAVKLKIPIVADTAQGETWADCKG